MNVPQILTAKALAVAYNNGSRSSHGALSTTVKVKIDNRSSKEGTSASNLSGGVDRPMGVRELAGYMWAWGDKPPIFVNDLFDLIFTMDGVYAVQIVGAGNTGVRCRGIEVIVEPYDKQKKNFVYYLVHIGGAGSDFSDAGLVSGLADLPDTTQPTLLNVKSLGVQFAYWVPTGQTLNGTVGPALTWSPLCYYAGMKLSISALADPTWASCLNGIAYFPPGTIDWKLELGQFLERWPIPKAVNSGVPYMLPGEPGATPGTYNINGDAVYPDLDAVVGIRMVTRVNSNLTANSYWQLLYGTLSEKAADLDHDSSQSMQVRYVFEKAGSMLSRTNDTGYSVGSISYVTGDNTGGSPTTTQFWP